MLSLDQPDSALGSSAGDVKETLCSVCHTIDRVIVGGDQHTLVSQHLADSRGLDAHRRRGDEMGVW